MAKEQGSPNNVVALPTNCSVEKCTKKVSRLKFCEEHFVWLKEGLVTKEGKKPNDFDKKFQAFSTRHKKSA